jgi:hypothetical protein
MRLIDKAIFIIIFFSVGALTYGWLYNANRIAEAQQLSITNFVNAGPRFTAYDGKELCEYQNVIAKHSIGFQQSGLPSLDCDKYLMSK